MSKAGRVSLTTHMLKELTQKAAALDTSSLGGAASLFTF